MLAGCIIASPTPSIRRTANSMANPVVKAVRAVSELQTAKEIANGYLAPYLSTSQPAGIWSAA